MNCLLNLVLFCALSVSSLFGSATIDSALVDAQTCYDLDLVPSGKNSLSLFFDKTVTKRGAIQLNTFLLNPTDDQATLLKRQRHVRFLVDHADLSTSLQNELVGLAAYEPTAQEYVSNQLGEQSLDRVYFTWSKLKQFNTNPYALDFAYGMHITAMLAPFVEHVLIHLGIDILANGSHVGCSHAHHNHAASKATYYGLQAFHWGLHAPGLYDMACDIKDRALMIKYVQAQTIRIAEYVHRAENVYKLLKKSDADANDFSPYAELDYFFGNPAACSDSFKKLMELLKTSTFQGEASVWSHVGNVLAAYKLYGSVQDEFERLAKAISEIDVYLSAATFVREQTSEQPWCFATFSADTKPKLEIENVRHLFIVDSKPLDYSSDKSLRTLVTGDNGSGKSTYLMSIGQAIILAQTFGIVPAKRCEITPFSHIHTFRYIHDNMSEGTSRFYAECARVDTIIETISSDAKPACVIFDEPFSHTNAEKGTTCLQKSLADISVLDNAISLVATHYHDFGTVVEDAWNVKELPVRVSA